MDDRFAVGVALKVPPAYVKKRVNIRIYAQIVNPMDQQTLAWRKITHTSAWNVLGNTFSKQTHIAGMFVDIICHKTQMAFAFGFQNTKTGGIPVANWFVYAGGGGGQSPAYVKGPLTDYELNGVFYVRAQAFVFGGEDIVHSPNAPVIVKYGKDKPIGGKADDPDEGVLELRDAFAVSALPDYAFQVRSVVPFL